MMAESSPKLLAKEGDIESMKLPPCHLLYQFNVADGKLHCGMTMRSCDIFLGLPFNIASYALLNMMVAQVTGLVAGDVVISLGDTHLYSNHLEQAQRQLAREPGKLPSVVLNPAVKSLFDFKFDDIQLEGYAPQKGILAPIAV